MERANAQSVSRASVLRGSALREEGKAQGTYLFKCIKADGSIRWEDTIKNVVCTVGKNAMLDAALAGSSYTVTGPFMGLISSVGYTGIPVVADTMSSHASSGHVWVEAGSSTNYPLYTGNRKTCSWAAASGGSKALSATADFVIVTTGGTVKGAFIVFGTGAVNTIADTNGVLYSAGVFTGGDKVVDVADTIQASYSTSL